MTEIRMLEDPITRKRFYAKTCVLAIDGLDEYLKKNKIKKSNYAKYIKDLKQIKNSGSFYFDENTLNKPENILKGYLRATFMNEQNGILEILTTNKYYEISDGVMSDTKERK